MKYRMRTARDHPIAPPSGIVPVSRLVLFEKIGPGPHPCHWCGKQIDWLPGGPFVPGALLSDHVDFDTNNDTPENLVPSCNTCNGHRTREMNKQLIAEGEKTMLWSGRRTRAVERQCERCGEPFLTIPAEVGKGKGRFCSRSCARSKSAA